MKITYTTSVSPHSSGRFRTMHREISTSSKGQCAYKAWTKAEYAEKGYPDELLIEGTIPVAALAPLLAQISNIYIPDPDTFPFTFDCGKAEISLLGSTSSVSITWYSTNLPDSAFVRETVRFFEALETLYPFPIDPKEKDDLEKMLE